MGGLSISLLFGISGEKDRDTGVPLGIISLVSLFLFSITSIFFALLIHIQSINIFLEDSCIIRIEWSYKWCFRNCTKTVIIKSEDVSKFDLEPSYENRVDVLYFDKDNKKRFLIPTSVFADEGRHFVNTLNKHFNIEINESTSYYQL